MRYQQAKDIKAELTKIKEDRYKLYKIYSKLNNGFNTTGIVLGVLSTAEATAGVATTLTVIGAPVGAILAGVGGVTSIISIGTAAIGKTMEKRS
jgi:small-conductance mechanosensitive channel